ncbi:hypothetical protein ABGB19_00935 [Mycobacterium sp. B14F4]|uniref:hypothetical protein n=1 Tax=Mycobacterium sp. B14F4 TaxID=3153565 RepID=UPI00325EC055
MEPPHSYLRDASASVVHHGDYLNSRDDHALCGIVFENPIKLDQAEPPTAVCGNCETKLVQYHLNWWRERAEAVTAELDALRFKYRQLAGDADDRRASAAPVPAEAEPTTLLGHARKELLQLCRQFDDAVPYRRVKNAMQAFSDGLSTDERVLLAQEIGADGSLIRWSTREAESLGWDVTDNPMRGEPEDMWDAWTRDSYQTPKQGRWRLGRSRSHHGG